MLSLKVYIPYKFYQFYGSIIIIEHVQIIDGQKDIFRCSNLYFLLQENMLLVYKKEELKETGETSGLIY